jgi:hypothetical protein
MKRRRKDEKEYFPLSVMFRADSGRRSSGFLGPGKIPFQAG